MLTSVSVNVERIEGGVLPNLSPQAKIAADIRVRVVGRFCDLEQLLHKLLGGMESARRTVDCRVEPSHTEPEHEISRQIVASAATVLVMPPVTNIRVGGFDARLSRKATISTVVYRPTPFNMGRAGEHVLVDGREALVRFHALTASNLLNKSMN